MLKRNKKTEKKDSGLNQLKLITNALNVGVIICADEGLRASNRLMERLAENFGGLSSFEINNSDSLERTLTGANENKFTFRITKIILNGKKILLVQDITAGSQSKSQKHVEMHDVLTGLPSRSLFYDRLQHSILIVERENKPLSLLILDVDNFKEINDNMGHNFGDQVLKQIGERLQSVMRKTDTVARFGGDEFVMILPSAGIEHAQKAACRMLSVLEEPFIIEGKNILVATSVGIVLCPEHGEQADDLIQNAEAALNVAKQDHCGVFVYNPKADQTRRSRLVLSGQLRNAIENEELELYYQPKIECKTGYIIGVEALVRWNHPELGYIPPTDFINLAEQTGLINPLTLWVLNTALNQCSKLHRAGIKIRMSINLSTRNLLDPNLKDEVSKRLKMWGIDADWLELEITESALMVNPIRAMEVLNYLDALGVRISIDDFGTGYSSLSYLKRMPVDEIKVDKSFVFNMARDNNDAVIVRSTIELAHNLGLKVTAEGVEHREIWEMLKMLGCDKIQGYYISRPLSAPKLMDWLKNSEYRYPGKPRK